MEQIKKPTFNETVDVLVKAYLNNTLEQGNCHACAVGNLIAHANGFEYRRTIFGGLYSTGGIKNSTWFGGLRDPNMRFFRSVVMPTEEALATGYTAEELTTIEHAFERVKLTIDKTMDDLMFEGLMAVVDELARIHNVDLSVAEQAKTLFVRG